MQAIVLAGGLGTRLRGAVPDLPKPMAPIGDKPFLELLLERLAREGIERVVLAVGYRGDQIRRHFGDRCGGLAIDYAAEETPLGTGGAIVHALDRVAAPPDEPVFTLNGDTWVELDYRAMLRDHLERRTRPSEMSMALHRLEAAPRYGTVRVVDGHVVGFRPEGGAGPTWVNAGVYLLSRGLFEGASLADRFSFEHDFLAPKIGEIAPLAFIAEGLFIDIGVPSEYERAQSALR